MRVRVIAPKEKPPPCLTANHMMRLLLPFFLFGLIALPALASNDGLVAGGIFPMQGNCPAAGMTQFPPENIQPNLSLWSCSGQSQNQLNFSFQNGAAENCLYIDNFDQKAFFVPLRTWTEWNAFKQSTSGGMLRDKIQLTYGCLAATVSNTCGGTASLPASRNATAITIHVDDRDVTYTCAASNGCGTWSMTAATGYCHVNGLCGAANGVETTTAPTSNLCAAGEPSAVSGGGPWDWTCYGEHGGSNAFCAAAPPPCPSSLSLSARADTARLEPNPWSCCTPNWVITGYGPCSKSCGGGMQDVYWGDGCGLVSTTQQGCNAQACYRWTYIGQSCEGWGGGCWYMGVTHGAPCDVPGQYCSFTTSGNCPPYYPFQHAILRCQ